MSLSEFVDSLGLSFGGEENNGAYIITLNSSDDFGKLHTEVSTNNDLHVEENDVATNDNAVFVYHDEEGLFEIKLVADFDEDYYRCTVEGI